MSNSYFESRRQLIEEDGVDTGAWPITWFRIAKGWGILSETFWAETKDGVIPPEPPNVDQVAKHNRLKDYQRLRSETQCFFAIAHGRPHTIALEISKAWSTENAPKGKISLESEHAPVAIHSIGRAKIDLDEEQFVFPNSWGTGWGDEGFGYLPFGYLTRFMVEAWTYPPIFTPTIPRKPGIDFRIQQSETSPLGLPWIVELLDGDHDIMAGWALIVQKQNSFDVEELFVRPDYRRRGLGARIGSEILKLQPGINVPIRFWIPWGDHEQRNAPGLLGWAQKLGLRLEPSGVRWAAYRAQLGTPVDTLPALEWVAKKATSPLCALDDEPVVSESFEAETWTEDLATRRAELVEKKYRTSLTELEQSELDQLQEQFGQYQDFIAPFFPQ